MDKIIEYTKSYIFCERCGKCYMYKGSYEKHKLACSKIEVINVGNIILSPENNIKFETPTDKDNELYSREKLDEILDKEFLIEQEKLMDFLILLYLFTMTVILGFMKGIFMGF
jgi:hypothetical protein